MKDSKKLIRHPFAYLVEAADDICNLIIDLEDAHRLKLLSFNKLKEDILNYLDCLDEYLNANKTPVNYKKEAKDEISFSEEDNNESMSILRSKFIKSLIRTCSHIFYTERFNIYSGNGLRNSSNKLVSSIFDSNDCLITIQKGINKLKKENIYNHEPVLKIELAGYTVLGGLLSEFIPAIIAQKKERSSKQKKLINLIPRQFLFEIDDDENDFNILIKDEGFRDNLLNTFNADKTQSLKYIKMLSITEFVSCMTDSFALEIYRNITGVSVPKY